MTNAMIIFAESLKLMEQGILAGSGNKVILDDGTECEMPEAIHTYQKWKALGYQVNKGEKAVAQFCVWKNTVKKDEDGEERNKMFLKKSSFFKASQCKLIEK